MIKRAIVLVVLFISGCASKPFQPPTKTYEDWIDGRHSELEIKKALLECGYPSPFTDYPSHMNSKEFIEKMKGGVFNRDTYVKNHRCMLKAGFVNNMKESFYCDDSPGLPCVKDKVCQPVSTSCDLPWDKIPDRNITKRLESDYCKHKIYRTYPVCQP